MKELESPRKILNVADTDAIHVITSPNFSSVFIKFLDCENDFSINLSRQTLDHLYYKLKKLKYHISATENGKKSKKVKRN